ncbi:MAG: hypothetical protein Q9168_003261 [Polycauliona sp. 1 TL-2023]
MASVDHSKQASETFCHPEQHQEQHQEAHEETHGAGAQQQPILEPAAAMNKPGNDGERKALELHNQARQAISKEKGHGRPDLVWDDKLESDAAAYAQHLCRANQGLQHSSGDSRKGQGENLYWSKPNGGLEQATKGWLDEKKNYHGENIADGNFGSYGHYTQAIWPGTKRVGVAMAKDSDGGVFVVGRYSPPGNFMGKNAYQG